METTEITASPLVFTDTQKQQVERLLSDLSENQKVWLAGYLTGITQTRSLTQTSAPIQNESSLVGAGSTQHELTILYGSRTGNGEYVANRLKSQANASGFNVQIHSMSDYSLQKLPSEKNLLIIVSTHGAGVPPVAAEDFYNFIHSKKVKPFADTHFSVLALGDKSYVHFCKTGIDVDVKLEKLGAKRLHPRIDCDVDFQEDSDLWINGVLSKLTKTSSPSVSIGTQIDTKKQADIVPIAVYNRKNPFEAQVVDKVKLSGRGSAKEVFHYELSLENSGIIYEPGDAVGIYPANPERLVEEFTSALKINSTDEIEFDGGKLPLAKALLHRYELSSLNPDVIGKYNQLAQSKKLKKILADPKLLEAFAYENDLVDLVTQFPVSVAASELTNFLQKIQPRLYSIASSLNAYPDEVHLTVSAVRYHNSRYKEGVCSTFLSDRITDNETLLIYPERNPDFRLPKDAQTPVIMVGPGTGIAPFRSFLQEREALGATGKNWLFFGDRNFTTDFLYQTELLAWHKKGLLNHLNVAFSRDTDHKIYVQHRMHEQAQELVSWLDEGAHFYVCGDAARMGKDVNQALIDIISKVKSISAEGAASYLKAMKRGNRYQTDLY